MRTTNTPTAGLKDHLFWIWSFCADLFNSFSWKAGTQLLWRMVCEPHGSSSAHISMSGTFKFLLPRQKLFSQKSSRLDHLLFFFTVVSRSHTPKDRLCPLGMGLPQIQYSVYRRLLVFFSAFSAMIFLHLSSMSSFFECPGFQEMLRKWPW